MTAQEIITTTAQTTDLRDVYEPTSTADAYKLATYLAKSGMLGSGIRTAEQALTVMITGRELGLRSMQALRGIHVIDGKPTLSADLIAALCLRSAECEYFQVIETSSTSCTYETKRRGWPQPSRLTWTIEQARDAGLAGKQNWQKFPDAMLRARCITGLARMVYPDLFAGVYDPDEVDRTPAPRNVTNDAKVIDMPVREIAPDTAPATEGDATQEAEQPSPLVQTASRLFASIKDNRKFPVVSRHGWKRTSEGGSSVAKWLEAQDDETLQTVIDELQAVQELVASANVQAQETVDPASSEAIPW